jgi:hypothetical protein
LITSQLAPVPLYFSQITPDFRFSTGNLVPRRSAAYVTAQLGAITPEFTEVLAQLRATPLNITVTLPNCAAPGSVRAAAIGGSQITEQ